MRGYGRVEEDLDEYENDELDEYEEDIEGDEFEEEEEVEDPTPKREVQEYLELRQKLKEAARKKLAKQSGSGSNPRDSKRSKLDNFGSFFGPSRPVIAERVIQESKSFLETRQEMPRVSSSQKEIRRGPSGTSAPKDGMIERRPHNPVKTKVENLKNTRDYSFLLSEDADVPRAANLPPARGAVSVQVPPRSKESVHARRQLPNVDGERRPAVANSHIRPGPKSIQKPPPSIRVDSRRQERVAVPEHKKHYPVSGHENGTRRPALPKGVPSTKKEAYPIKKVPSHLEKKVVGASTERKAPPVSTLKNPSVAVARVAMANGQRPHVLKSQTSVRQQLEESIQGSKGKILPKQSSSSLKPQMKAPKQMPPRFSKEEDSYRSRLQSQPQRPQLKPKPKPKPKPVSRYPYEEDEDNEAIFAIRKMFRYNPEKYNDDGDDLSDMEVGFNTIQMEERRSAKIAKEEDEIEWQKIQEEEEREARSRQRRLAKRKMDQR